MFCSDSCKEAHETLTSSKTSIDHYRQAAKQLSPIESIYKQLAKENNFCIMCGKSHQPKSIATTYKKLLQNSCFVFVTLLPFGYVQLVANDDKSYITTTK